ncbi:MAG TPA: hydroxyacylglutathione hydrolase [Rhodanobacter sp.]
MHLIPLPALADNYIWLLHDDNGHAIVVDPGDAEVVEQALSAHRLQLCAILLTHHHYDHVDGVAGLRAHHDVPVYAPVDQRIETATQRVRDGDRIELPAPAVTFDVIKVPGHTLSHVAYVGAGLLFCGDTLFSLGCGRLFEGTPEQMLGSLDRLSSLPGDTLVCGGHEYTEANGRFARTIEPDNPELRQRLQQVAALRQQSQPTLPVPLAGELATNPFLRVDTEAVIRWSEQQAIAGDRIARFAAVRSAKDNFPG